MHPLSRRKPTMTDTTSNLFSMPGGDMLPRFDQLGAFEAYEAIRHHFPKATFPAGSESVDHLGLLADRYDLFVFDAFGVLNVGETAIPGAVARMAALTAMGKTCIILSNAASYDGEAACHKFKRLGFDFAADHIVTSRQAALAAMAGRTAVTRWTVLGLAAAEAGALPVEVTFPENKADFDTAEGFLFLSTLRWNAGKQALLEASLKNNPRPVIVANPDIIAPREDGLSTEPGFFGYRLAELGLGHVAFHGKPFPSIYDLVRQRFPGHRPDRICMIGDTLHTDILGAAAAGWKTALATRHGMLKGLDIPAAIARSGIVPDHILPTI